MNIVITGAGNGLGFETVLELLKDPQNKIIALSRSTGKLKTHLHGLGNDIFNRILLLDFNICSGNPELELAGACTSFLPVVDVLINNAGALINKPFTEVSTDDFRQMMEVNFYGHIHMIRFLLPRFNPGGAHIVNIGSMGAFQGSEKFPGLTAYSASKAALMNLSESLATELAPQKIRVNGLALGSANTDMLRKAFPGYESPLSAAEMARFIAGFALTGHQFFNGKIIPVALMNP